ncbi:hypothetical protein [Halobacterium yunchengense]|uniref:hypothetical protein n=1 Tax=Halobacterium yunchengense TaxID=3108497 RepID=UPI00300A6586
MGMRTAIGQMGWLPLAALLVLLWTVVTAVNVVGTMQPYAGLGGEQVGQTFLGGAAGLLVLLGFGAAVAYAYAEMGETDPAPESFPPR